MDSITSSGTVTRPSGVLTGATLTLSHVTGTLLEEVNRKPSLSLSLSLSKCTAVYVYALHLPIKVFYTGCTSGPNMYRYIIPSLGLLQRS